MIRPKDYTKQGVLNWICIQDDDKDMFEIIEMCKKKMDAMEFLREQELQPLRNKFNYLSIKDQQQVLKEMNEGRKEFKEAMKILDKLKE